MPKKPAARQVSPVPTLAEIRALAANSENIISTLPGPSAKAKARGITRRAIEQCCQNGTIDEGPFLNERGDWQVTMFRHAAGNELKVVLVIKDGQLIVRSNH